MNDSGPYIAQALANTEQSCRDVDTAIVLTPLGPRRNKLASAHMHLRMAEKHLKEILAMEQDEARKHNG